MCFYIIHTLNIWKSNDNYASSSESTQIQHIAVSDKPWKLHFTCKCDETDAILMGFFERFGKSHHVSLLSEWYISMLSLN